MEQWNGALELLNKKRYKEIGSVMEEKLFRCLAISIVLLGYIFDKNQDLYQIIRNIILFYGLKLIVYLDINCQNTKLETDDNQQEESLESEHRVPVEANEIHCIPASRVYPQGWTIHNMHDFISMFPGERLPSIDRHVENSAVNRAHETSSQVPNNRSHHSRNDTPSDFRTSRNNSSRLSAHTQPFIPNRH